MAPPAHATAESDALTGPCAVTAADPPPARSRPADGARVGRLRRDRAGLGRGKGSLQSTSPARRTMCTACALPTGVHRAGARGGPPRELWESTGRTRGDASGARRRGPRPARCPRTGGASLSDGEDASRESGTQAARSEATHRVTTAGSTRAPVARRSSRRLVWRGRELRLWTPHTRRCKATLERRRRRASGLRHLARRADHRIRGPGSRREAVGCDLAHMRSCSRGPRRHGDLLCVHPRRGPPGDRQLRRNAAPLGRGRPPNARRAGGARGLDRRLRRRAGRAAPRLDKLGGHHKDVGHLPRPRSRAASRSQSLGLDVLAVRGRTGACDVRR